MVSFVAPLNKSPNKRPSNLKLMLESNKPVKPVRPNKSVFKKLRMLVVLN
jgi:hypothetical protein